MVQKVWRPRKGKDKDNPRGGGGGKSSGEANKESPKDSGSRFQILDEEGMSTEGDNPTIMQGIGGVKQGGTGVRGHVKEKHHAAKPGTDKDKNTKGKDKGKKEDSSTEKKEGSQIPTFHIPKRISVEGHALINVDTNSYQEWDPRGKK